MSRLSIRNGIAEAITAADMTYVGTCYPARPVILEESAYVTNMMGQATAESASGSAAVLVVNVPKDTRMRRADTGRGAVNDTRIHDIELEVFFTSTGGDGIAAQNDYDTVIDQLVQFVRDNPTVAGAWSSGEYQAGVEHTQAEPQTDSDGLTILIAGVVRWEAWEWESGPTPR